MTAICRFARRANLSHRSSLIARANHRLIWPSRARKRGVSTVTKRWARGAMGATCHKTSDAARTAKSCGPDAPTLAFKSRRSVCAAMVARKPGHQGEHDISRKAIAQGRPDCLRFTCMLVCAFPVHHCARDRGCSAHPVFPAPSTVSGANEMANLGQRLSRECGSMPHRHCEEHLRRSNPALHVRRWIASSQVLLAMTVWMGRLK